MCVCDTLFYVSYVTRYFILDILVSKTDKGDKSKYTVHRGDILTCFRLSF